MRWVVEYYKQADTTQPAEDFEISLMRHHKKLGAKLRGTFMSRFHQRLREDLRDPEFASAFYEMSVDIALLQVLEQVRKSLNVSEKELAERMGIQRSTVTRLFNATHPNPTLDTISDILRALGLQAEIKISPASPEDAPIPIKATFVPV